MTDDTTQTELWREPTQCDIGKEFLIKHASFVDADFCPEGVVVGTIIHGAGDEIDAACAVWCGYHDRYEHREHMGNFLIRELNTRQPTGVAAAAALQMAAKTVLHNHSKPEDNRTWVGERPYVCEETAYRAILALIPPDDLTALEKDRKATEAAALKEAASLVPSGSDEWFDNLRPVHWKRMMAVLRKEILALIPPTDEKE